ncbi:NmrA domain-containing protein [Fusarium sp. Ph1]|nr:NmrA domain-containing protein [Fusarium sp. Ph1]
MSVQARKIAIVGGTGTVGSRTLSSLLDKNIHTIMAISRSDSSATFPENATVLKGDYSDENFLVSALKGQVVLILQLSPTAMSVQESFIRAAAKAGVPYILPTEFGTDIEALDLTREQPITSGKKGSRDLVEQLGVSSWITVERKAEIWNGGNVKANTSTLKRVGAAVAELLSRPEEELSAYKNRPFYVSSFFISQMEILERMQRITGTTDADWEIKERDIDEFGRECDERLKKGI